MNPKGSGNIILVVVMVVIAGMAGYFIFFKTSTPADQQTPSEIQESPASPVLTKQLFRNESFGFVVPSSATLIKTEFIPQCETPMWLSYCNVTAYTYQLRSDFELIKRWFLKEAKDNGWTCFTGEEKTYIKAMGGSWQTECTKNNLTYGIKRNEENGTTTVIIFVPQK